MKVDPGSSDATAAFDALEQGVYAALENYSNVHRGSGHHSMVSTYLFEQARGIVLEHLGLSAGQHVVIFGTPQIGGHAGRPARAGKLPHRVKPRRRPAAGRPRAGGRATGAAERAAGPHRGRDRKVGRC